MSIRFLLSPTTKTGLVVTGLLVAIAGCAPSPAPTPVGAAPVAAAPVVKSLPQLANVGDKQSCVPRRGETLGNAFVRLKVRHLRAPTATDRTVGFDYKSNGYADPAGRVGYHRPVFDDAHSRATTTALAAAFGFLKPAFQLALCKNLDYVFVDDNDGNFSDDGDSGMGWAFWEVTAKQTQDYPSRDPVPATTEDQADGRGRFIALPGRLVANPPSVQDLLHTTTEKLLGRPVPADFITVTSSKRSVGAGTMKSAALAAVMLHELGHVLWFQTCVAGMSTKCEAFRMVGWKTDLTWPRSGIHNPKMPLGAIRKDGTAPGIDDVASAARGGDLTPLYALLGVGPSVANSNNWVSLLSAAAPDEDFAETFTILGLQKNEVEVDYHGPRTSPSLTHVVSSFNPTKARLAEDLLPALVGTTTNLSGERLRPRVR